MVKDEKSIRRRNGQTYTPRSPSATTAKASSARTCPTSSTAFTAARTRARTALASGWHWPKPSLTPRAGILPSTANVEWGRASRSAFSAGWFRVQPSVSFAVGATSITKEAVFEIPASYCTSLRHTLHQESPDSEPGSVLLAESYFL